MSIGRQRRFAAAATKSRSDVVIAPGIVTAVETKATVGEVADTLREVFGGKRTVSMFEMTKLVNDNLKNP